MLIAESVALSQPRKPQPHLGWAILWNMGFAATLFGTIIGIVLMVVIALAVMGDPRLKQAGGEGDAQIPRPIADALAVSFPLAYLAGLVFAVVALRVVVGRDWTRQIGLRRPSGLHVLLVVIGLPGFVIGSELIARILMGLFGSGGGGNQEEMLRELFLPFPWWFAVLAIGIGPGVVEELWCRGFLGRGLVGRYGWVIGICLTSLLFGLLHVYPPWYVLVTATMGIWLHLVYLASRSLWVSMLLHAMNNGLVALLAVGALPGERLERNVNASPALIILLGLGLLVFVGVALATGRARLVAVDPLLPVWEPPYPGVIPPPSGSNAELRVGRSSPLAIICAIVTSAALIYLLIR